MTNDFELFNQLERSDTLCCPNPQTLLVSTFEQRNFEEFENILKNGLRNSRVDLNYFYEDPRNGTLLDLACSSPSNSRFVSLLISYGANVNNFNKFYKKSPLHLAVEKSDTETVKILTECKGIDINCLDSYNNSALHIASKLNQVEYLKLLLKHPRIDINIQNRKEQTPLHLALNHNRKEAVLILLQQSNIDLDTVKNFAGKTCREMIREKYPDIEMQIRERTGPFIDKNKNLFSLLYARDFKSFINHCKLMKNRLNENDGQHTYLQYVCEFGFPELVKLLIDSGVDPNLYCPSNCLPPIMIAAYNGFYNIVRLLVENADISFDPVNSETVLHAILNGFTIGGGTLGASNEDRNHYKCLEFLLNNVSNEKLDINYPNTEGNTVLHYAVKINDADVITLLLKKGAYAGQKNIFGDIPLTFISPKLLEDYLNDCITTNGQQSREDNYEIIYKYDFLTPPRTCPYDEKLTKLLSKNNKIHETYDVVSETEPLVMMSDVPELRPLLKHPVFTSFLNLKWYTIRKYFYVNVTLYVTFWLLLTLYILTIYGSSKNSEEKLPNEPSSGRILWLVTVILCGAITLRELFQFSVSPCKYLSSFENWLEIGLIITTFIILCRVAYDFRSQIAAVAILLSWTELVLLIGRHPSLSTNVEMFKVVCWNFLKFLAWYSILILAFALSFYMLFKDRSNKEDQTQFFTDPVMSIFKSVIMLTGEFDAASIPFSTHPGTSHILFVLFVFLIAIVLFNLLNGLAVSDTAAIKSDAELVSYVCRAKLITYIENMALGDPFPCFNVLDKLSCFCCCVPLPRITATRHKHIKMLYKRINLFPLILPDREVRVRPNQKNQVVMQNSVIHNKRQNSNSDCFDSCTEWFIDPAIVKESKKILELKLISSTPYNHDNNEFIKMYLNQMKGYEDKLKTLQESSQRNERTMAQIINLLNKKS